MAFDIYPQPQTAPLSLAASSTGAAVGITERVAVDPVTTLQTMWIRVALLGPGPCALPGAAPFVVRLTASGGPTVAVPVHPAPFAEVRDGSNALVANVKMWSEANGLYRIEVYFPTGNTGQSWEMSIQNADASAHRYTWVVGDQNAEASQPWLDVSGTTSPAGELHFDCSGKRILTGQEAYEVLQVSNLGTGPLQVTDSPGVLGSSDFEIVSVPGPIGPNQCDNVVVRYNAPSSPGQSTPEVYAVASDDATALSDPSSEHNRQVTLHGAAGRFEMVLLADSSGSMGRQPDGTAHVSPNDRRWDKLVEASQEFLDLILVFGGGLGRFGVASFPDGFHVAPSSQDVQLPADITASNVESAKDALDAMEPGGETPMGHGMQRVVDDTAGDFGYFLGTSSPSDADVEFNERWLVLMSDGVHNQGPPAPGDFLPGGAFPSFTDKNIRVITVAYGDPGSSWYAPDHALLGQIAAQSSGIALDAGANDNDIDGLRSSFIKAVEASLCLDAWTDPVSTLTGATPEHRHEATVTPYDRTVAFVVNWSSYDEDRVRLQLLTPNCEVITPESARQLDGVDYLGQVRHGLFAVSQRFIRNDNDPANPRYGVWTLIVSGVDLDDGETEQYEHQILMDSRLKLEVGRDRAVHYAGDDIGLEISATLDGRPLPAVSVTLDVTRPGQSWDNWIATSTVSGERYARSSETLGEVDVDALTIKAHALHEQGFVFQAYRGSTRTTLSDPDGDGVFETTVGNTSTPGSYEIYVTATGTTPDGWMFRREKKVQLYLDVRPDPGWSVVDFGDLVFRDDRFVGKVRLQLRDRFGNYLVPRRPDDPRIHLALKGGELGDDVVLEADGRISRSITFERQRKPTLAVAFEGETLIATRNLVSLQDIRFANRVVEFEKGVEGEEGINRHADPEAVLGDVTTKEPDRFLALGGGGAVTLEPDEGLLRAQGGDDVTVFVKQTDDPRPYAVEVLPEGADAWVRIGTSGGETRSFGMRSAGVDRATRVRVTDLSGQVLDAERKASATPGVALAGVGFHSAEAGVGGLLVEDIDGIAGRFDGALVERGVVGLRRLAEADPEELGDAVPEARKREFIAKARLALEVAGKLPRVEGAAKLTLWDIVSTPPERLARSADMEREDARRLHEAVAPLQMALDDTALRRLTLDDLRGGE